MRVTSFGFNVQLGKRIHARNIPITKLTKTVSGNYLKKYYSLGGFKRLRNTNYMYKLKVGYKENLVNGAIQ